jgi:hypothetical protein
MNKNRVAAKTVMTILALALLGSAGVLFSPLGYADEGGVSFWFPVQYGSMAAVPSEPGWSLPLIYYHGSGDADGSKQFSKGGSIRLGLEDDIDVLIAAPTYVFITPVLNGQAAVSVAAAYGRVEVDADATLTGPGGGVLSGSATVGPRSISMGRADYNEAINKTEDEQMLLSIVKGRYGETFSLLAVSGVAANVRFRTNAGVEVGWGPKQNYDGNLVPFSGGLAYEENPTITYAPVQGEQYLRQLLSPIPLNLLVLIIRSGTNPARFLILLANRINNMRNPDFLEAPSAEPAPRFQRFIELCEELDRSGVMQLVEDPRKDVPFDILISDYAPAYSEKVREYLNLLGLPLPAEESKDIVLPVYFAVKGRELYGIAISTRSTFDLIEILRAAIEIPQDHAGAGLAMQYPTMGLAGKNIRIHASKKKPKRAVVAVKHHGYWFYIDETDMQTKLFYVMVRTLWTVSIAAAADQGTAPVLTIPVSR